MPAPLPRSKGQSEVIIAGQVWDELCDRIEKLEGLKVANGSSLSMLDLPGGKVLDVKSRPQQKGIERMTVVSVPSGGSFLLKQPQAVCTRADGTTEVTVRTLSQRRATDIIYAFELEDPADGSPAFQWNLEELSTEPTWQEVPRFQTPMVVKLDVASGSGTPGSPFTYDAYAEAYNTTFDPLHALGTGLSPLISEQRSVVTMTFATHGLLDFDVNGEARLILCNEIISPASGCIVS